MKKHQDHKRVLRVNREIVRALSVRELQNVAGGNTQANPCAGSTEPGVCQEK
jgi:hypothetical protein